MSLPHRKAAADIYCGTGHVVAAPARKENRHAGDFLGFAEPTDANSVDIFRFICSQCRIHHFCVH